MRYWWVNRNQTYRQEVGGGYLWSPKVNKNGKLNAFYEFVREVAPSDLVLSLAHTLSKAIGIATSSGCDCPKPPEFGTAGNVWGQTGWRVDVRWLELKHTFKSGSHMDALGPYLPDKYSPLTPSGSGLEDAYLTRVPPGLADAAISQNTVALAKEVHIKRAHCW
jgi:hypothetical protein